MDFAILRPYGQRPPCEAGPEIEVRNQGSEIRNNLAPPAINTAILRDSQRSPREAGQEIEVRNQRSEV